MPPPGSATLCDPSRRFGTCLDVPGLHHETPSVSNLLAHPLGSGIRQTRIVRSITAENAVHNSNRVRKSPRCPHIVETNMTAGDSAVTERLKLPLLNQLPSVGDWWRCCKPRGLRRGLWAKGSNAWQKSPRYRLYAFPASKCIA